MKTEKKFKFVQYLSKFRTIKILLKNWKTISSIFIKISNDQNILPQQAVFLIFCQFSFCSSRKTFFATISSRVRRRVLRYGKEMEIINCFSSTFIATLLLLLLPEHNQRPFFRILTSCWGNCHTMNELWFCRIYTASA